MKKPYKYRKVKCKACGLVHFVDFKITKCLNCGEKIIYNFEKKKVGA